MVEAEENFRSMLLVRRIAQRLADEEEARGAEAKRLLEEGGSVHDDFSISARYSMQVTRYIELIKS